MVSEARAAQPGGRNVLDELDSRIPTNFYWYLAVLACIGGFLFGYDTSNIGSALGFLPYHLSSFATGYLVAGASLGAAAGALIAGPLTDHFGRKALLIAVALRSNMPESPRWLMLHERYADTRKAFGRLGMDVTEDEVRSAADQLYRQQRQQKARVQWTRGVRRALIIVVVFFVFQQITGINVPFYYGPTILSSYFQSGNDAVAATVAGVEATAILAAVNVVATYFAFRWIDKKGRRPLAIGGYAGMTVFILVAALGVGFLVGIPQVVLVMVGFSFFITSFAIGVGGTGWLIQGEVFPTAVRGRAAAIGACADWLANYALIEAFPIWHNTIGLGWVMVCFAGLCLMAILFIARFLPETKGHSVEEITAIFDRQAARAMPTGG